MALMVDKQSPVHGIVSALPVISADRRSALLDVLCKFGIHYDMAFIEGTAWVACHYHRALLHYIANYKLYELLGYQLVFGGRGEGLVHTVSVVLLSRLSGSHEGRSDPCRANDNRPPLARQHPLRLSRNERYYSHNQDNEIKVAIPEDFHIKSLDRINSFRNSHRSTVEQVRIKK